MPAPRPVQINYGSAGLAGLLALRVGEGHQRNNRAAEAQNIIDSTRQYQLAQQQIQSQERMFAMEQAYRNRPGGGGGRTGPTTYYGQQESIQPAQLQQQQLNDQLRSMIARGTIDEATADRVRLSSMGVPASVASLGIDPQETLKPLSPQEQRLRADFNMDAQIGALEQQRKIAESQMQAFVNSVPGGTAGMNEQERRQYSQFVEQITAARQQQQEIYRQFSGALPGGQMSPQGAAQQQAAPQQPQGENPANVAYDPAGRKHVWNGREWVPAQ